MIPSFSSARDSRADNVNIYRLVQCGRHSAIQIVRADVYCYNCIPLNVEHDSEIRLDFGGVNDATITSRKLLDFVGAHAGIKWVLFEDKKRLACATLLLRGQLFRNFSRTRESRGTDISFITRIRLIQRGIQVYKSASFCIGHPLLKRFGDPGVVVFYDEFGDLCTFAGWKGLELLNEVQWRSY